MKRGQWPTTLSHRLRGSTLGIFGLGGIGALVAEAGRGLGMQVLVLGRQGSLDRAKALQLSARPSCSSGRTCSRCTCASPRQHAASSEKTTLPA
jgi:phosphoglycerate dehydrogenase-like enzyme